jgi:hypothetical protein
VGIYKERDKFSERQILAGIARGMSAMRLENVLGEIPANGPKMGSNRHRGSRID